MTQRCPWLTQSVASGSSVKRSSQSPPMSTAMNDPPPNVTLSRRKFKAKVGEHHVEQELSKVQVEPTRSVSATISQSGAEVRLDVSVHKPKPMPRQKTPSPTGEAALTSTSHNHRWQHDFRPYLCGTFQNTHRLQSHLLVTHLSL